MRHWTETESKDLVSERVASRSLILTVTCRCCRAQRISEGGVKVCARLMLAMSRSRVFMMQLRGASDWWQSETSPLVVLPAPRGSLRGTFRRCWSHPAAQCGDIAPRGQVRPPVEATRPSGDDLLDAAVINIIEDEVADGRLTGPWTEKTPSEPWMTTRFRTRTARRPSQRNRYRRRRCGCRDLQMFAACGTWRRHQFPTLHRRGGQHSIPPGLCLPLGPVYPERKAVVALEMFASKRITDILMNSTLADCDVVP